MTSEQPFEDSTLVAILVMKFVIDEHKGIMCQANCWSGLFYSKRASELESGHRLPERLPNNTLAQLAVLTGYDELGDRSGCSFWISILVAPSRCC